MTSYAVTSEAVLFFDRQRISKCMLYSDFEAIVDGMVGIPEYAERSIPIAYCQVSGDLLVNALVLFTLSFDEDGLADSAWNLPLQHLADQAKPGPDMGGGNIRLVCRSQSPVDWLTDQLWDPVIDKTRNDFVVIRDVLLERGKRMGLHLFTAQPSSSDIDDNSVPVLKADTGPSEREIIARHDKMRLAGVLKQQRRRAQLAGRSHQKELEQLRYTQEQKEDILSSQLEKTLAQLGELEQQNTELKARAEALRNQVDTLNSSLEEQLSRSSTQGDEIEILTEQYRAALKQRLEEERALLAEQLHGKEMDLFKRDEQIADLQYQLSDAKYQQVRMANSGVDKLLDKLQELGVNLVVYHLGAGHISIQADELSDYLQNPTGFAANKCDVSEDTYAAWLKHYENPVCQVPINGETCGKKVMRIDVPRQFQLGVSDCNVNRCIHCQSDKAIENVVKSRGKKA